MRTGALPPIAALPISLSRFYGRERELPHLRQLLGGNRLVTITGTGGIGKTRIALEAARSLIGDFPEGLWFAELAQVETDDVVAPAIASAVRAPETGGVPALERAARRLEVGRQLLVLDNCEHVLLAVRVTVEQLLTRCEELVILATSRERLGIPGEISWSLPPLAVPTPDDIGEAALLKTEAVTLFCDRAQLTAPNGELLIGSAEDVAKICVRLDGLPLALELAAAWVPVLSLSQVLERVDQALSLHTPGRERLGRHRTMRAAVDWSYQLLTEPERAAFDRFSVFVGGFTLESAEVLLEDASPHGTSSLEMIATLVARSLVTSETSGDVARYHLLEPVRQYAAAQLRSRPDQEHESHALMLSYLAGLAESAEEAILGGPDTPWLRRLDAELANIRAALTWGFDVSRETAARLATALPVYCFQRGLFPEGRDWARMALQTSGRLRARALFMSGWFAGELGEADAATEALIESNRMTTEGGWQEDLVLVLWVQGLAAYVRDDLDTMESVGVEAVLLARQLHDDARLMRALWVPATCAGAKGNHELSLKLYQQAHAIANRLGNQGWGQLLLSNIASEALESGDVTAARDALTTALDSSGRGDPTVDANLIESAGILAVNTGACAKGLTLLAASHAFYASIVYRLTQDSAANLRKWVDKAHTLIDSDVAEKAWNYGLELPLSQALVEARTTVAASLVVATPVTAVERRSGNAFIREGEFWSLTYDREVARLKDSKGLRDIARLIGTPGREVAAVDLAAREVVDTPRRAQTVAELGLRVEGDVGEVLDAEARAEYRARLSELEVEINEAESNNDPERAGRDREERELLLAELGAAVGLGGRARRGLDPAERARKAVSGRIRDAISRIESAHPQLGRHLRRSVRTGSFCVYEPPEPAPWKL
jgi:predicted ATPase